MKTKHIISISGLIAAIFLLGILVGFKQSEPKQTEDYALVIVREVGFGCEIATTIGEQETTLEFIKWSIKFDKKLSSNNYGLVIKKLHSLNMLGFNLISTNYLQNSLNNEEIVFVFKRKIDN